MQYNIYVNDELFKTISVEGQQYDTLSIINMVRQDREAKNLSDNYRLRIEPAE